jgi:hypothetical protein
VILGFIDPINWGELISFILSGTDISTDIVWEIAFHPYWLVWMVFLVFVGIFLFLLASSYSLLLQANLSLHYLKEKPLKYKKNLYFSRPHITTFMSLLCWNIMYLLAPVIIWAGVVFFMYLFFNIGFIWLQALSVLIAIITVMLIICIIYLTYRIIFWYVLLAKDSKKKKLLSWKEYVGESIAATRWSSFWKFLFVFIAYTLILIPFTSSDVYLETESVYLRDTILYNSGLINNIEPESIPYYEYITSEYSHMSDEVIMNKIDSFYALRVILFFLMYLIIEGLFVFIATSFYLRVLSKK